MKKFENMKKIKKFKPTFFAIFAAVFAVLFVFSVQTAEGAAAQETGLDAKVVAMERLGKAVEDVAIGLDSSALGELSAELAKIPAGQLASRIGEINGELVGLREQITSVEKRVGQEKTFLRRFL